MTKLFVPTLEITWVALSVGLFIWVVGGFFYGLEGERKKMGKNPEPPKTETSAFLARQRLLMGHSAENGKEERKEEGKEEGNEGIPPVKVASLKKERNKQPLPDPRDEHQGRPKNGDSHFQPLKSSARHQVKEASNEPISRSLAPIGPEDQREPSGRPDSGIGDVSFAKPNDEPSSEGPLGEDASLEVSSQVKNKLPLRCSQWTIDLIKHFEGFSARPYKCSANVYTIGYGTTYGASGRLINHDHPPINRSRAEELLIRDMYHIERGLLRIVKVKLKHHEWGALCSLAYNIGLPQLAASTLLRKLNRGEKEEAANEFPRWVYAGRTFLKGLKRRRLIERNMFLGDV